MGRQETPPYFTERTPLKMLFDVTKLPSNFSDFERMVYAVYCLCAVTVYIRVFVVLQIKLSTDMKLENLAYNFDTTTISSTLNSTNWVFQLN